MLNNLKAEMARYEIRSKDLAGLLGVREATISAKMTGKSRFRLDEINLIKENFFPHLTVEYLFEV